MDVLEHQLMIERINFRTPELESEPNQEFLKANTKSASNLHFAAFCIMSIRVKIAVPKFSAFLLFVLGFFRLRVRYDVTLVRVNYITNASQMIEEKRCSRSYTIRFVKW